MRRLLLLVGLVLGAGATEASAWGCDGHEAVGLVAERLLDARTRAAVTRVLAASPVDPALRRFCGPAESPFADAATWADDHRNRDARTAGWHFINFPRAIDASGADYRAYCTRGNCVIDAIAAQYRIVVEARNPRERADALRFLVHLIGDVHQPMHAITNGDRGGNCLPVQFFDEVPRAGDNEAYRPNLHNVWDDDLLDRVMRGRRLADAQSLAGHLLERGTTAVQAQAPTGARVTSWARDTHALARSVAYGRLPVAVPVEPADASLTSCAGNRNVSRRSAGLRVRVGQPYVDASAPVLLGQLRLAGERLASVLKAAFPEAG